MSSKARNDGASAATRHGAPLTAIFLALALSAVMMALLGPAMGDIKAQRMDSWSLVRACLTGSAYGIVLGISLGLYHFRRIQGVVWGCLSGALAGACVGPATIATNYEQMVVTCLGGSLLLILTGAICRLASR